jgi:hypothetical protein
VVVPDQKADSHALLTRPPLTPKGAFDLHVLSRPPAFILSQDQTLHFVEFVALETIRFPLLLASGFFSPNPIFFDEVIVLLWLSNYYFF